MCSRYSLTSPPEAVRALFDLEKLEGFPPRYNIAPTDPVLIVRAGQQWGIQPDNGSGRVARQPHLVRWGLIPSWVKDPREFSTLINARAETASEKPSFRAAMRHRRCLVPTDGFYEWTGRPGAKQPHLVRLKSETLFAMAGIYEHWLGADGSEIETMAILTTSANTDMAPIHDRMPVIIRPEHYNVWLDCRPQSASPIEGLLAPSRDGVIEIRPVNPKLNNPRTEGPELHVPPPDLQSATLR